MARKLSPGVHNIRIKKPGGGTRMQRVNVLKSGKFKFIKNVKGAAKPKAKKSAKPRGKAKRTSPGRRKTMARRKMSLPNRLINAGLMALAFMPVLVRLPALISNPRAAVNDLIGKYTGDLGLGKKFNPAAAAEAYAPLGVAFILFEVKKAAMKKFRF